MKENIFCENLQKLVGSYDSKSDFARKCGTTPSTLNGWLKGTSAPDVPKLLKIVRETGVDIRELVGLPVNEESKVAATIEPGSPEKKKALQEQSRNGNLISLTPTHHEFLRDIEGWLNERSAAKDADQFQFLKGYLEYKFPDFTEYLKKQARDAAQDRLQTPLSSNGNK